MPDNQTVSNSQSLIRKVIFIYLALVQSQIEQFSFKTYKISEQQITPKCCQSPVLAIIMEILKMTKIVYKQMPAPQELQQIPTPLGKS